MSPTCYKAACLRHKECTIHQFKVKAKQSKKLSEAIYKATFFQANQKKSTTKQTHKKRDFHTIENRPSKIFNYLHVISFMSVTITQFISFLYLQHKINFDKTHKFSISEKNKHFSARLIYAKTCHNLCKFYIKIKLLLPLHQ